MSEYPEWFEAEVGPFDRSTRTELDERYRRRRAERREARREAARALYRSPLWSDERLANLRLAFLLDMQAGADAEFCWERIVVIDEVLNERRQR